MLQDSSWRMELKDVCFFAPPKIEIDAYEKFSKKYGKVYYEKSLCVFQIFVSNTNLSFFQNFVCLKVIPPAGSLHTS